MQPTYWNQVIERYKDSGLKQEEFCSQDSISITKFKYYWQKYRNDLKAKSPLSTKSVRPNFEPVSIKTKTSSSPVLTSKLNHHSLSIKFSNDMVCSLNFEGSNLELAKFLKEMAPL